MPTAATRVSATLSRAISRIIPIAATISTYCTKVDNILLIFIQ